MVFLAIAVQTSVVDTCNDVTKLGVDSELIACKDGL